MVMAVKTGPNGGIGIQVFPPAHIPQHSPVTCGYHNRLALEPVPHLGEWVPEITMIQFSQRMHATGLPMRQVSIPNSFARQQVVRVPRHYARPSGSHGVAPTREQQWDTGLQ